MCGGSCRTSWSGAAAARQYGTDRGGRGAGGLPTQVGGWRFETERAFGMVPVYPARSTRSSGAIGQRLNSETRCAGRLLKQVNER